LLYSSTGADKQIKHDWLHTGELVQVGFAWRLTDVPGTEEGSPNPPVGPNVAGNNPKVNDILEKIGKLDMAGLNLQPNSPKYKEYLQARAALVSEMIPLADAKDREGWYKQLFDNWSALAQAGDAAALKSL